MEGAISASASVSTGGRFPFLHTWPACDHLRRRRRCHPRLHLLVSRTEIVGEIGLFQVRLAWLEAIKRRLCL